MNKWEAVSGIVILLVGLVVAWQSYTTSVQCNSLGGKISTFITSIFGGNQAQACYNTQIIEVGGVIAAIIGLVIAYLAFTGKKGKK